MQEKKVLDYKNQETDFLVKDIRDKNLEKALSVVAPIDDILRNRGNLTTSGYRKGSFDSLIDHATNKVKMVEYSDVRFEDVYHKKSDGSFDAKFDTYSTINLDQEDYAARKQTSSDIWANALPKFLGKLTANTIGQLGGIAYGIGAAVNTGSMQSIYDNSFLDTINDANAYMDYKLPTWKTKEERSATGIDYLTNQKTWADDFLNGTAFFGGALLSELALEWATGGAAMSTAMARWGSKLENFASGINSARKLSNPANRAFSTGKLSTELATKLGKTGELLNTIRYTATSAGYESAFEANAYKKEVETNYYSSFEKLNGRMPTMEEELDFRKNLKTSADGVFGYNMAIVGPSNLAFPGKWLKVKNPLDSPGKWLDSKLFGIGYKKVEEEFVETASNKLQRAIGKTYSFTKPMFIEGVWEEGMQSVGNNTAKNWIESKYNPKYIKNSYDLVDSFSEGLAKTYGTSEGWKEIQMGMIIGLLGGAIGNKVATGMWNPGYTQEESKNKLIVDTRNTYSGKRVAEAMAYSTRIQSANESAEEAEAKGDFTGYELARQSTALAQLNFAYNLDYFEDAIENTVTSIKNIDNETLMKEHSVDENGAEEIKDKMISEYKNTAESYKKHRDFAEYFIGNKLSEDEAKDLKNHDVTALKEALAYQLTLGEKADKFSTDVLQAIKNKIATTVIGQEIADTITIDHVLTKAGKDVKKEGEKKVLQITKLKQELLNLEQEYKNVQNTFYNSVSDEEKKTLLNKLDKITSEKQQIEEQRIALAKEYEILFTTASMKNPFSKEQSNIVISLSKLDTLKEQSGSISNLVADYQKVNPQEAAQLSKLVEEYGRSLDAFQTYADLTRQITDPSLGLRGKRNFISEIRKDKSSNDTAAEVIQNLLPRMAEAKEQATIATIEGNEEVKKVTGEKKGATIDKVEKTEKVEEPTTRKSIKETVVEMIKNSPYLLEYFGEESLPKTPTIEEIEEFYDLAAKAIDDPKIDTDTIAFKSPYTEKRLGRKNIALNKKEVARLQELNNKMADWQLLEGLSNKDNISIKDMLLQDIAVNQSVEPIITSEVTEEELITNSSTEPKQTDKGDGIRNEEVVQVYQDVFVRRNQAGTIISHLSLPGLLSRMNISDSIGYAQVTTQKGKKVVTKGSIKNIGISEVLDNIVPGANFVLTFADGQTATISIERSGALLIAKPEDFVKVFDEAGLNYVDNTLTNKAGFSPVYDKSTGTKLNTDYTDSSEYAPMELYNMIPGNSVTFSINLASEYNQKAIEKYLEASPEQEEEAYKELANNLKINVIDIKGRKLGDLKANYDTSEGSEFLLLREEAAKLALQKEADVSDIDIRLSKESFIKHIFLGVPNFVFEEGKVKYFDIVPDSIVDYGFVQNGEVLLKGNTKNVRMDYIKDLLKKEGLPIAVFKQGEYIVAFPMNLKEGEAQIGDKALESLMQSDSLGTGVLDLNNILANNGLSPSKYNLFYLGEDNQSLFAEGKVTKALENAINDLNKVKKVADVKQWMSQDHTKESLVDQASIAIDITNNPLTSPKPVINLNRMVEFKDDWYAETLRVGELSDEKAIEIATKIFSGDSLTPKEANFVDDIKVTGVLDQFTKLQEDLDKASRDAQNEPC